MGLIFIFIFASFILLIALTILSMLFGSMDTKNIFGCSHEWQIIEKIDMRKKGKVKYIFKCKKCGILKSEII